MNPPPGGASAEEVSKLKKDLDKALIEAKQARNQEKLKCEYLERECQQLRDKYDELKHRSIQFELASQQLYLNYIAINEKIKSVDSRPSAAGVIKISE